MDGWVNKPAIGTPLKLGHSQLDGLVLWYLFQEDAGGIINDLSGKGNNGTLNDFNFPSTVTSGWNPGKFGKTLAYDDLDDWVDAPGPVVTGTPATFCAWVNSRDFTDDSAQHIIAVGVDGVSPNVMALRIDEATPVVHEGHVSIQARDGATNVFFRGDTVLLINTWYHLAAVFESDVSRSVYLNGKWEATDTTVLDPLVGLNYTAVGVLKHGSGDISVMDGLIDDARIYNKALIEAEIQDIMHNPFAAFDDGIDIALLAQLGYSGRGIGRGIGRGVMR